MRIAGPEVTWVRLAIRSRRVRKVTSWIAITVATVASIVGILRISLGICGHYGTENDN